MWCCNAGVVNMHICCSWCYGACSIPEATITVVVLQVLTDLPAVGKMAAAKDLHAFLNKYHKHAYRLVMPCALHCNLPVPTWRMCMLPVADKADGCSIFPLDCVQINQRLVHNCC